MRPDQTLRHLPTGGRRGPLLCGISVILTSLACGVMGASGPSQASAQVPAAPAAAPDPAGYVTVESPALPDRLVEIVSDSTFSILIDRAAADEEQRLMIDRAERLVPTTEHLDAILEAGHGPNMTSGNWPNLLQEARDAEAEHGPRWWWIKWDRTLLPVALVAPALHHYVELFRTRSVTPNPFGPEDHRGHLSYSARVEVVAGERAGETPWVVVQELSFRYWCGRLCALTFAHGRRVYFDASGNAVRIEGDRVPAAEVS